MTKKKKIYIVCLSIDASTLPIIFPLLETYYNEYGKYPDRYEWLTHPANYNKTQALIDIIANKPDILGLSCYIWNIDDLNFIAREYKKINPSAIIVSGGPHQDVTYNQFIFKERPFVDVILEPGSHGEWFFTDILDQYAADNLNYSNVYGAIYNNFGLPKQSKATRNSRDFVWPKESIYKRHSKYFIDGKNHNNQVIYEFSRGCPYSCSFCEWGVGGFKKIVRKHPDTIQSDFMHMIFNSCFICDANFGQSNQDITDFQSVIDVATVQNKEFSMHFSGVAKNNKKNVLEMFKLGHLSKKITFEKLFAIAVQDFDQNVKKINDRTDLPIAELANFRTELYAQTGLDTSVQLIIGLPGKTLESFYNDFNIINKHFRSKVPYRASSCIVLPDTPLADPVFLKKHGVKTLLVMYRFIPQKLPTIVETNTYTFAEWLEMIVMHQVFNQLMVGNFILPGVTYSSLMKAFWESSIKNIPDLVILFESLKSNFSNNQAISIPIEIVIQKLITSHLKYIKTEYVKICQTTFSNTHDS